MYKIVSLCPKVPVLRLGFRLFVNPQAADTGFAGPLEHPTLPVHQWATEMVLMTQRLCIDEIEKESWYKSYFSNLADEFIKETAWSDDEWARFFKMSGAQNPELVIENNMSVFEWLSYLRSSARQGRLRYKARRGIFVHQFVAKTNKVPLFRSIRDRVSTDEISAQLSRFSGQWLPRDREFLTAMHVAADTQQVDVMKVLYEHDNDLVTAKDVFGRTPLFFAFRRANREVVDFLVDRGADPFERDSSGNIPINELFHAEKAQFLYLFDRLEEESPRSVLDFQSDWDILRRDLGAFHRRAAKARFMDVSYTLSQLPREAAQLATAKTQFTQLSELLKQAESLVEGVRGRYWTPPKVLQELVQESFLRFTKLPRFIKQEYDESLFALLDSFIYIKLVLSKSQNPVERRIHRALFELDGMGMFPDLIQFLSYHSDQIARRCDQVLPMDDSHVQMRLPFFRFGQVAQYLNDLHALSGMSRLLADLKEGLPAKKERQSTMSWVRQMTKSEKLAILWVKKQLGERLHSNKVSTAVRHAIGSARVSKFVTARNKKAHYDPLVLEVERSRFKSSADSKVVSILDQIMEISDIVDKVSKRWLSQPLMLTRGGVVNNQGDLDRLQILYGETSDVVFLQNQGQKDTLVTLLDHSKLHKENRFKKLVSLLTCQLDQAVPKVSKEILSVCLFGISDKYPGAKEGSNNGRLVKSAKSLQQDLRLVKPDKNATKSIIKKYTLDKKLVKKSKKRFAFDGAELITAAPERPTYSAPSDSLRKTLSSYARLMQRVLGLTDHQLREYGQLFAERSLDQVSSGAEKLREIRKQWMASPIKRYAAYVVYVEAVERTRSATSEDVSEESLPFEDCRNELMHANPFFLSFSEGSNRLFEACVKLAIVAGNPQRVPT